MSQPHLPDLHVPPTQRVCLTSSVAGEVLKARRARKDRATVSLDLNRSRSVVRIEGRKVVFPDEAELSVDDLRSLSRRGKRVFVVRGGELVPVERQGTYHYRLLATDTAPTLEMSGVKMHRTEGCCPYTQAELIVRSVVTTGDRFLDTCGGLGYTAIWAARLGAERVVSVEYDLDVLELARLNPWSEEYFFDSRIDVIPEDVTDYLASQPSGSFDSAVHDPPHFSRAAPLYDKHFYFELSRVLGASGKMYHYVGVPFSRRGQKDFHRSIAQHLSSAGFDAEYDRELMGFVCRKRR